MNNLESNNSLESMEERSLEMVNMVGLMNLLMNGRLSLSTSTTMLLALTLKLT